MDEVAEVDEALIAEVLAVATGIPLGNFSAEDPRDCSPWRTTCTSA